MKEKTMLNEVKDLINNYVTEKMNHLQDDSFSKKSKEYKEKLLSVEKHGVYMQEKKAEARKEISEIKRQLALLSAEHLKETDSKKIKEIEKTKKELRLKLDDLTDLVNTNISAVINGKYIKDLDLPEQESLQEYERFKSEAGEIQKELKELQDLIQGHFMMLDNKKLGHLYNSNRSLLERVKNNSFDPNDGWVGKGNYNRNGKEVLVYDGSSLEKEESGTGGLFLGR